MKKNKKPSGLSQLLGLLIIFAIFSPIIAFIGKAFVILIVTVALAGIFYIFYSLVNSIKNHKMDESSSCDLLKNENSHRKPYTSVEAVIATENYSVSPSNTNSSLTFELTTKRPKELIHMSFTDIFRAKKYRIELEQTRKQLQELQALITPELQNTINLKNATLELQHSIEQYQKDLQLLSQTAHSLDEAISLKKSQIIWLDDEILVQEFGLYEPQYDFSNSLDYKEHLVQIRQFQKTLIKEKKAVSGNTDWQVNGSISQGRKMVSDTQKLLLRAFNSECDALISKVKYNNFDASLERIQKSADAISKLGKIMNIAITAPYLGLKIQELRLAFEYQQKKQEEKEKQRAARAEMREAARLQKEIEEQRRKIEKEQTHYQTAYTKILNQLLATPNDIALQEKKKELEAHLNDIEKAIADIDYREANQKAGYVYVISNIGSFGENIYKIGMTRRLDPQDRIDELGDASVPFNFDVHAMIFSDNAPALEAALHKAFENKKLNMVNTRREFFNVTLDEIKEVVKKNFDNTVEFIDVPEAEQYRISKKMHEDSNYK